MLIIEIVVVGLASYRCWRLLAIDQITQPLRERIETKGWLWDWLSCPWCSGTWLALGVAFGASVLGWIAGPPLVVGIAAAVVTGYLGDRL